MPVRGTGPGTPGLGLFHEMPGSRPKAVGHGSEGSHPDRALQRIGLRRAVHRRRDRLRLPPGPLLRPGDGTVHFAGPADGADGERVRVRGREPTEPHRSDGPMHTVPRRCLERVESCGHFRGRHGSSSRGSGGCPYSRCRGCERCSDGNRLSRQHSHWKCRFQTRSEHSNNTRGNGIRRLWSGGSQRADRGDKDLDRSGALRNRGRCQCYRLPSVDLVLSSCKC